MSQTARAKFSRRSAFILAAAASAVGLGDLWRFPAVAYENGGGAFLITYVAIVFTIGVVMMLTEMAIGRRTGLTGVSAFEKYSKKWKFLGVLCTFAPILIGSYYCTIGGWTFYYLFQSLFGNGAMLVDGGFFEIFRSCGLDGILNNPYVWFLVFLTMTILFNVLGVNRGIETSSIVLIPALIVLVVLITAVSLMNGGAEYVDVYVNLDVSDFTPKMILAAVSQAFFSISVSFGMLITYGSYMKKDVDMEKSTIAVIAIDVFVSLIAGLLIVTSVFAFGSFTTVPDGDGLLFSVMPSVFAAMGPIGSGIEIAFYLLVAFAAISSSISILEIPIASFSDRPNFTRKKALAVTTLIIIVLGTLTTLGYGPLDLDGIPMGGFLSLFDFTANSLLIPIIGILTCIFVGYIMKPETIVDELEQGGKCRIKKIYAPLIKYVCPIIIAIIMVTGLIG